MVCKQGEFLGNDLGKYAPGLEGRTRELVLSLADEFENASLSEVTRMLMVGHWMLGIPEYPRNLHRGEPQYWQNLQSIYRDFTSIASIAFHPTNILPEHLPDQYEEAVVLLQKMIFNFLRYILVCDQVEPEHLSQLRRISADLESVSLSAFGDYMENLKSRV